MNRKATAATLGAAALLAATVTPSEAAPTAHEWFVPMEITGETAGKVFDELPQNKVCAFNQPANGATNIDSDGFAKQRSGDAWYDDLLENSPYGAYAKFAEFEYAKDSDDYFASAKALFGELASPAGRLLAPSSTILPRFYDPANPAKTYTADYTEWLGEYATESFSGEGLVQAANFAVSDAKNNIEAGKKNLTSTDEFMSSSAAGQIQRGTFVQAVNEDYLKSLQDCVNALGYNDLAIEGAPAEANVTIDSEAPTEETPADEKTGETEKTADEAPADGSSETGRIIGIIAGVLAAVAALIGAASYFAPQLGIKLPF